MPRQVIEHWEDVLTVDVTEGVILSNVALESSSNLPGLLVYPENGDTDTIDGQFILKFKMESVVPSTNLTLKMKVCSFVTTLLCEGVDLIFQGGHAQFNAPRNATVAKYDRSEYHILPSDGTVFGMGSKKRANYSMPALEPPPKRRRIEIPSLESDEDMADNMNGDEDADDDMKADVEMKEWDVCDCATCIPMSPDDQKRLQMIVTARAFAAKAWVPKNKVNEELQTGLFSPLPMRNTTQCCLPCSNWQDHAG